MPINSFLYPAKNVPVAYEVANSCRFNDDDSAYMNVTSVSTVTNRLKFTISLWVKRSTLGAKSMIGTVGGDNTNFGAIWFDSSDRLNCTEGSGGGTLNFITNRLFRDVSAWYNIILAIDTTQGTESNRVKIYVNGVQETSFSTSTYPGQNSNMHLNRNGKVQYLGRHTDSSNDYYFDGYMAEVVWVDGQQLDQTSFGEFDSDSPTIWKPKDVSGLTFGNNGFYLDFEDSGDLGDDESGNGNDWGENNLAATDQSTDTCTNNFCTFNGVNPYGGTLSEGNLAMAQTSYQHHVQGTLGMESGKWYWEYKISATHGEFGVCEQSKAQQVDPQANIGFYFLYNNGNSTGYIWNNATAGGNVSTLSVSAFTSGMIINLAYDADNQALYIGQNGTFLNSGDPTSGSSKTGALVTNLYPRYGGTIVPFVGSGSNSVAQSTSANFGSPSYSISSGNADANNFGNFEYTVPSGYFSLCTKNLAEFG